MTTQPATEPATADDADAAKNVIRTLLDSVDAGDFDTALATIDPACHVRVPQALPWGGVTEGLEDFLALLVLMADKFKVDILSYELWGSGDTPIARIQNNWTAKHTGRTTHMQVVEIYKVRDGKIVDIDVYYQDPDILQAMAAEEA
ncbi:nuclear transport factor 2 family protein [Pseudonocardia dioxanivorans]|jgi:ketosteroid isomerase-like protein|uniref:nuclear transport factor 2 family protein n=1 Tax=Pseudonocardia dioxanivorans TaxID=240495 RepID=UPI000CD2250B|nr:nuclear transport factor 2 family protein [Pseudonocardia dioxanivorans]